MFLLKRFEKRPGFACSFGSSLLVVWTISDLAELCLNKEWDIKSLEIPSELFDVNIDLIGVKEVVVWSCGVSSLKSDLTNLLLERADFSFILNWIRMLKI